MPDKPIKVLVLNGSLKPSADTSNTEELAQLVLDHMEGIDSEILRLRDFNILPGVSEKEGGGRVDEWPEIAGKIKAADIVLFCTPIWWGHRSSLLQRVIERMDSFNEQEKDTGINPIPNKLAGIVVTGSEDGAQAIIGALMSTLSWLGFTIPPDAGVYWVGEVGIDPAEDAERRRGSEAAEMMAEKAAESLMHFAQLLRAYPLPPQA